MAILSKGHTFADGDDVTSTKANNLVDQATFVSGASGTTDDSTLEVNGSGRLQVKDSGITTGKIGASAVTTAKLANSTTTTDGVTFPKMRYIADMRVIGNVSGGSTYPAEVQILDEDDMASNSATSLASQQSIKAYTDTKVADRVVSYSGTSVGPINLTTSYQDLDLSSVVGANRAIVFLEVYGGSATRLVQFRKKGSSYVRWSTLATGANESIVSTGDTGSVIVVTTNASGVVEYIADGASTGVTVNVEAYQVLST